MLSIVIPTLNVAPAFGPTLAALAEAAFVGIAHEIVVSDGGSSDGTLDIARAAGARVIEGAAGRGPQLAAGAATAEGDWLLFLHADTRLAPGWVAAVEEFTARPENAARAAYFRLALDDANPAARRIERLAALRCWLLALPYGDQGLLIARNLYRAVGGFRPLPLMEDVDLARRLGRRRLAALGHPALTSAARYRRDGWIARPLRNLACLGLWFAGMAPARIERLYR
ncbi:MAG: TIGR04283 family arsenosugar biosynthesis glycosyltransferase [Rhodospirillales bacterium]|nr:TIGR04283 family arsenosugar biosynthesis glycosyltransferase [Rhodospirillales bacterium]